jgi:HAD superfamily hydrolase (TIGR01549 family)
MSPPSPLHAVLFDWDGTLVDSAEASYRCYARVFAGFGIPFDRAWFARTYSPDWYRTYRAVGLPEERWEEADALWLEHYRSERAALRPGARQALVRLREARLKLGVVTSGERERVCRELHELELAPLVGLLVGGGDYVQRKPHPEALLLALERLQVSAQSAAYVGDSPEDVEMARAAGVYSVGIPGGFPNREPLVASRPDLLAASLEEAAGHLAGDASP